MKQVALPFILLIFLASCSTSRNQVYQNVESNQVEVGIIEDSLFMIEVAYVGAIGHSFIFECTIQNKADIPMIVDKSQFVMGVGDEKTIYPVVESDVIQKLKKDKNKLKKRRKTETILGAITVGLFAALGASEGISPAETLLFTAEPIFYIFDDRRWYKNNIESIDDEVAYIQAAQFHHLALPIDQSITRDLLFPTTRITEDVDIIFRIRDQQYIITFQKETFR